MNIKSRAGNENGNPSLHPVFKGSTVLKALVFCLFVPVLHAQNASPGKIRTAASRATAITQQGSAGFYKFMVCFSCHDHALPVLAWQTARERGIPVDEKVASQVATKGLLTVPDFSSIDSAVQDPMIIDPAPSDGWALIAAHAAGVQPNLVTAAYARRVANWQRADGHWPTGDDRPPQSYSLFTATALAARAVQLYMPAQLRQETAERLARAKAWLLTARPQSTEDSTYRLFGLYWAGATGDETKRAAAELMALQRPGGGWAELPHMQPDAYSTGEALVALHEAGGVPVTNPAWRKGLQYLLATQDERGAWRVHTRMLSPAAVSPPYLETGFPYGHDQFLSTDATCWAAIALMLALPKAATPALPRPLTALSPKGLQPWMETALFGTAAELKTALDGGLNPNSRTAQGTTLLMMAAPDAEKVKLLIDRGADVRAKAKSGYTALMVATTYLGTSESVKLLLAGGADVREKDADSMTPLHWAVVAHHADVVKVLLAGGADVNAVDRFGYTPLLYAATIDFGDAETATALLQAGADPNLKDKTGKTALAQARDFPYLRAALESAGGKP